MPHSVPNLIEISAKANKVVLSELIEKINIGLLANAELGIRGFVFDDVEKVVNASVYKHIEEQYMNFGYELCLLTPIKSHPFHQIWLKY